MLMENKLARYPNYANTLTTAEVVYRRNSACLDRPPTHRRLSRNLQEISSHLPTQKPIIKLEVLPILGPYPQIVQCCNCNERRYTKIVHEIGAKTHITALFFSFFGMCCIPYFCQRFKYPSHFCNNCNQYLGSSQL